VVVDALQDDAYKGIIRIDTSIMKNLGLKRGDIIEIKGKHKAVAIVDRAYPADVGENIIRIDNILRKNAKISIGDFVSISPIQIKEAKKVIIAPAQKGIMIQADPKNLRKGLLGRVMIKGDLIVLGGVQRRRDLMSEEFGDLNDVFGNLGDIFGGMGIGGLDEGGIMQTKFVVISTNPNVPIIITENTDVVLKEKAIETKFSEEDISQEKLINISKLPDLKNYLQLKSIEDFHKLVSKINFVNKFEDFQRRIYLVGDYFWQIEKKVSNKKK